MSLFDPKVGAYLAASISRAQQGNWTLAVGLLDGLQMLLLNESKIDFLVRHRRVIMITGLVIMVLPFALGLRFGLLSGFMLFSLGVYCIFFRNWRSEPGVWMLACLLTVTLGPCWAFFEYLQWQAIFAPAANKPGRVVTWNQIRLCIDAGFALLIFAKTMTLVITVAIENWKRTQSRRQHSRI